MTSVAESERSVDLTEGPVPDDAGRGGWIVGLVAMCSAYLVVCAAGLWVRSPLGHDESVYALRARDLSDGWGIELGGYWADYRAPGLSIILAAANQVVGEHVTTMRLVVVGLGLVLLLATVWVAHEFGQRAAGLFGGGLMVVTSGYGLTTTRLLADVPGAAFAMLAVAVFVRDFRRGRLVTALWAVPLLTLASTVSRFGAPIMLGAGLAAAGLVLLPRVWRSRNWLLLVQSAGLAAALGLVIGLVVFTNWLSTGPASPASANQMLFEGKGLTAASGISDLSRVANPWSGYPNPLWSAPVAALWAVGLVLAVIAVVLGRRSWEPVVFGLSAGLMSVLGVAATVGLVVENYLVLSLPFWAVPAGVGYSWAIEEVTARFTSGTRTVVTAALCVLAAVVLIPSAAGEVRQHHRDLTLSFGTLRDGSVAAGEQLGDDCVLITSYLPQAGYYSQCQVWPWLGIEPGRPLADILGESLARVAADSDPGSTAILVLDRGKRQPANELLEEGVGLESNPIEAGDPDVGRGRARAFRLSECVWTEQC